MNDAYRNTGRRARLLAFAGAAALMTAAAGVGAQEPPQLNGDPERGEAAFTHEYKCFACHGYDAQTGERRLIPMNYTSFCPLQVWRRFVPVIPSKCLIGCGF